MPASLRSAQGSGLDRDGPRIGPNTVVQTLRALEEAYGKDRARQLEKEAGLPEVTLEGLIPEALFVRLIAELRRALSKEASEAVLERAGALTAAYVRRHRIPAAFRTLLGVLPPRVGLPLLLSAFRRHAWTFAGGGKFSFAGGYPGTIFLVGCPTCRPKNEQGAHWGFKSGSYYRAAFEGLIQLAAPGYSVRETTCMGQGAPACAFEILRPAASAKTSGDPK